MKSLIFISLLLASSSALASHNRFWIGYKKESLATDKFLNGLNVFFKETVTLGAGKGLVSYQPYITQMKGDTPDEIALVTYENEEKYKAIRGTPEGKQYGERHWDFFEKEKSKSTVPTLFAGTLSNNGAYELSSDFSEWQGNVTYVVLYKNQTSDLATLAQEFESLKKSKDLNNSIILITDKFVYEYRSMKKKSKITPLALPVVEMKRLPGFEIGNFPVTGFGEGINFRFSK
ncbi:hypothetical protein [Bdellovibrio sp. HCB337]|uniref:hypothetical protein n=1 Tax=Bdellovibrio sp. HCB337 TaxID=3394358 RepID=UPI0039A5467C